MGHCVVCGKRTNAESFTPVVEANGPKPGYCQGGPACCAHAVQGGDPIHFDGLTTANRMAEKPAGQGSSSSVLGHQQAVTGLVPPPRRGAAWKVCSAHVAANRSNHARLHDRSSAADVQLAVRQEQRQQQQHDVDAAARRQENEEQREQQVHVLQQEQEQQENEEQVAQQRQEQQVQVQRENVEQRQGAAAAAAAASATAAAAGQLALPFTGGVPTGLEVLFWHLYGSVCNARNLARGLGGMAAVVQAVTGLACDAEKQLLGYVQKEAKVRGRPQRRHAFAASVAAFAETEQGRYLQDLLDGGATEVRVDP